MSDVQKVREFVATSVGQAEALAAQEAAAGKSWVDRNMWWIVVGAVVMGALLGRFVL